MKLSIAALAIAGSTLMAQAQTPLPAPGFHHLQLNSVDPDRAIDFYTRHFASTSRTTWGGAPALKSANNVLILFNKVAAKPTIEPQSAIWHFGWHVTDLRETQAFMRSSNEARMYRMHTGDGDRMVDTSADTWPGTGAVLGLNAGQIAEAKARGDAPGGRANGFGYILGPDDAIIEYQGGQPVERMNHVHMWQDEVFCARVWYEKHLNAARSPARAGSPPPPTAENCKTARGPDRTWPAFPKDGMVRTPTAAVLFGDVAMTWYMNQGDKPLADTRGQLYDHIGLSVGDLDAWIAKLRGEGVKFLRDGAYEFGDTRAAMIEGPSREALVLVEVK